MRLKLVVAAFLAVLFLQSGTLEADQSRAPLPRDSVLHVQVIFQAAAKDPSAPKITKMANGSAFVIKHKEKWTVITAMHVVKENREATVYGTNYPKRVILRFQPMDDGDIAFAQIEGLPEGWAWLKQRDLPAKGGICAAWGFPRASAKPEGKHGVVNHEMTVTEIERAMLVKGSRYLMVTGTVIEGMSGGPVIGADGDVFGVVSHFNGLIQYTAILPDTAPMPPS